MSSIFNFEMNSLIIVLLFCCSVFVFGQDSDENSAIESMYAPVKSSTASKCEDERFKRQCGIKCGGKYTCTFEKCFCFMHKKHSKEPRTAKINPNLNNVIFVADSFEINDSVEKVKTLLLRQDTESPASSESRPALRHHIAHFCENLDTARKCIRDCMKLGKPAFCGKDHNCYCGHKYDDFHKDPVVNADDMYAEFKDLYTKYFGPTENSVNQIVVLPNGGENK